MQDILSGWQLQPKGCGCTLTHHTDKLYMHADTQIGAMHTVLMHHVHGCVPPSPQVPLKGHKQELLGLLKQIPDMFASNRVTDSCAGAAIEAAVALLKPTGGRVGAGLMFVEWAWGSRV